MDKDGFLEAVQTLKLSGRADLSDDQGRTLTKKLYVDPLPDNHVLRTVCSKKSTFLIGRKGTGKSTIFQSSQDWVNQQKDISWAYIDIRSLYESATSELLGSSSEIHGLTQEEIKKILIFRGFFVSLVDEIKIQLEKRIQSTFWGRFKGKISKGSEALFSELETFIAEINSDDFVNATGSFIEQNSTNFTSAERNQEAIGLSAGIGANITNVGANVGSTTELTGSQETISTSGKDFSNIYLRVFRVNEFIKKLKTLLSEIGISHLFIYFDDFSELSESVMQEIVSTLFVPLNNWTDKFILLKIALYPGREIKGQIDRTKVDEIFLDPYRAFGQNTIASMEERAIDFTKRLVTQRIDYFCDGEPEEFFSVKEDTLWEILFFASMGNPRILGYLLYFAYETSVLYERKIGVKEIKDASKRYYNEKLASYFSQQKFLHESFEEKSSIFSLGELLDALVKKAKELRTYTGLKAMKEHKGTPPTSHFFISEKFETVLSTLELNFFVTKYFIQRDRSNRNVTIYALNYGLCETESIAFGRLKEKREHRSYLFERIFDRDEAIKSFVKETREIVCGGCGVHHDLSKLDTLQDYDMLCPKCKNGICKVVGISTRYRSVFESVPAENLLASIDLDILKVLNGATLPLFAKDVASELDCSHQLIGKRAKTLIEKKLIYLEKDSTGRKQFSITNHAKEVYFS